MINNVLKRINAIFETTGTAPYTINNLTIDDVLSMKDYSVGVENLANSLTASKDYGNNIAYLDVSSDEQPDNLLYRASSEREFNPFLFTPGKRVTQGDSNLVTRLVSDILPSWKLIPKRSNSVICTNDYLEAIYYRSYGFRRNGVIYVIIPPNDAHIAIAPKADFWYSFDYIEDTTGLTSIDLVNKSLLTFLGFFYYVIDKDIASDIISEWPNEFLRTKRNVQNDYSKYNEAVKNLFLNENKATILRVINAIDQALSNKKFRDRIKPIFNLVIDNGPLSKLGNYIIKEKSMNNNISIIDILDDLFDPDKNNFETTLYSRFVDRVYQSCEVWTDKPCIFIDINDIKFLTELYHRFRG